MSNFSQISLDFGQEQALPPVPGDREGADDAGKPYMAAGGVGVRLKSYKQTAPPSKETASPTKETASSAPAAGGLFGEPEGAKQVEGMAAPEAPVEEFVATEEPEAMEGPVATERVEPGPSVEEPVAVEAPVVGESDFADEVHAAAAGPAARRPATTGKRAANERSTTKAASKRGRKSLKQVGAEADLIEIPEDEVLFRKQYYTMGEVSEMFRVNQSLLRFWEAEFDILQPRKNKKGDRYFRPVDIKNLHLIYHLLRQRKYTIEGAKEFLKKNKKAEERFEVIRRLQQIKAFLLEWKAQL